MRTICIKCQSFKIEYKIEDQFDILSYSLFMTDENGLLYIFIISSHFDY